MQRLTGELKHTAEAIEHNRKTDQPSGVRDLSKLDAEIMIHVAHGLGVWDSSFVRWRAGVLSVSFPNRSWFTMPIPRMVAAVARCSISTVMPSPSIPLSFRSTGVPILVFRSHLRVSCWPIRVSLSINRKFHPAVI